MEGCSLCIWKWPETDRSSGLAVRKTAWIELGESEGKLESTRTNWNLWGQNRTHSYLSCCWCRWSAGEVDAFTTELHVCLAPEAWRSWNRRCGGSWRSWGPVAALHQQCASRSVTSLQSAAGTWHLQSTRAAASLAPLKSYTNFSCDQSYLGTRLGREIWGTKFQFS